MTLSGHPIQIGNDALRRGDHFTATRAWIRALTTKQASVRQVSINLLISWELLDSSARGREERILIAETSPNVAHNLIADTAISQYARALASDLETGNSTQHFHNKLSSFAFERALESVLDERVDTVWLASRTAVCVVGALLARIIWGARIVASRESLIGAAPSYRGTILADLATIADDLERVASDVEASSFSGLRNICSLARDMHFLAQQYGLAPHRRNLTAEDRHVLQHAVSGKLFDGAAYATTYELGLMDDETAFAHYMYRGRHENLKPHPDFDADYYLRSNPDVAAAGVVPFVHFVMQGRAEGRPGRPRTLIDPTAVQTAADAAYVPFREPLFAFPATAPSVIAFYLPQFHEIAENNEWWGAGFTEWTNVRPAQPAFSGHYQPHVPDELGYYDLTDTETQRKQVALAKQYGVTGFCFYYYWFGGRRLLERPVENYLANEDLDLPFCLCWANENWSRRWDGLESEVLIAQNHSPEDDIAFIKSLAPYFSDRRYIRVGGRPLLLVYRPEILPDAVATVGRWRRWCMENGIGEIHLSLTHSFQKSDPRDYLFDSAVEFPPNNSGVPEITDQVVGLSKDFTGKIYDWQQLVERSKDYPTEQYAIFRAACPAWDNTARKKTRASILYGSSPRRYQEWLLNALKDARARLPMDEQIVFVNAWNEWAEGAHLEPDAKYGFAHLEATRVAQRRLQYGEGTLALTGDPRIAVVIHSFYPDVLAEILERVKIHSRLVRIYVTCPADKEAETRFLLDESSMAYSILVTENRGRDVLPFFKVYNDVATAGHAVLLKLHTKKSLHRADGNQWRNDMYHKLISLIPELSRMFDENPRLGAVAPQGHLIPMSSYWGSNQETVLRMASRLGVDVSDAMKLNFSAGTMFAARSAAFLPMAELIDDEDFDVENGQTDGTFAHAVERIFAIALHALGLTIVEGGDGKAVTPSGQNYAFAEKG